jgi:hypothetical protein
VPGSADTGPVPAFDRPGPQPAGPDEDGLPAGLDYAALLDALAASGALDTDPGDQDSEVADREAAEAEGRVQDADPAQVAAVVVEHMDPGPAQAGWLAVAAGAAGWLDEYDLAGVAIAARRAASRDQAVELAAVAQIAARAARADPKIGLRGDGRPARVGRDALGQIAMALRLTPYGAEERAELAVTLTWRLPATGAALAAGRVDLDRAEAIANATSVLDEEQARKVEEQILPEAGTITRALLRERLARAVIAADPEGAERRREQAERHADVRLYADDDHTATITASKLAQIEAAAGFARVTALARARKAAGLPGSLGFHRGQVLIALLLGTLPLIPPPDGAPPDQPPPDDDPGSDGGPRDGGPRDNHPGNDRPRDGGPRDNHPGEGHSGSGRPRDVGSGDSDGSGESDPGAGGPGDGDSLVEGHPDDSEPVGGGPWDDLPAPRDEDAPPDDGLDDDTGPDDGWDPAEEDDDPCGTRPVPQWPALGTIPPALARRRPGPPDGRPVPGLLDAVLPWTTLTGLAGTPGTLGRIGPITAAQARQLARAAETDPAAQWRVIVTNHLGQAIAVARIRRPRRRARDGPAVSRDGPPPGAGLVGRITVTITQDMITGRQHAGGPDPPGMPGGTVPPGGTDPPDPHGPLSPIAAAALRTAARALDQALAHAVADQAAGGCAHADESPAYRPPPREREFVIARDVTCRSPVCRQPAWRADLDHTLAYDHGGRTCRCNMGGACRGDHQLKQHPRWKLEQIRPGIFRWTAPGGRTYTVDPDTYPI